MKLKTPFGFGVVFVLAGAFMFAVGMFQKAPERSTFKTYEGTVASGKRITRKGDVRFELVLTIDPKNQRTLDLDPGQSSQENLESCIGLPVVAECDGSTCYVLTCQGKPIVTYEQSTASIANTADKTKLYSGIGIAFGLFLCMAGFIRGRMETSALDALSPAK